MLRPKSNEKNITKRLKKQGNEGINAKKGVKKRKKADRKKGDKKKTKDATKKKTNTATK